MRLLLLLPILAFSLYGYSQTTSPVRFLSDKYFETHQIGVTKNLVYGTAKDFSGKEVDLLLDVYFPLSDVDKMETPPLLVVFSAGGFITSKKEQLIRLCYHFARSGYVVASVDYRAGWIDPDIEVRCSGDPAKFRQAIYRGVQDANAALRFLTHPSSWAQFRPIDPQSVFLLGGSAGAVISINTAFVQQAEFDDYDPNLNQYCGPIASSGNQLPLAYEIQAIGNYGGAILDTRFITHQDAVPVISFHGRRDPVSPFRSGRVMGCPDDSGFPIFYGSKEISRRIYDLGNCIELTIDMQAGHGLNIEKEKTILWVKEFFLRVLNDSCTDKFIRKTRK